MSESKRTASDANVFQREANTKDSKPTINDRKVPITEKETDAASLWSDSACEVEDRDFRKKQVCSHDQQHTAGPALTQSDIQRLDVVLVSSRNSSAS